VRHPFAEVGPASDGASLSRIRRGFRTICSSSEVPITVTPGPLCNKYVDVELQIVATCEIVSPIPTRKCFNTASLTETSATTTRTKSMRSPTPQLSVSSGRTRMDGELYRMQTLTITTSIAQQITREDLKTILSDRMQIMIDVV
jgi:hypothetical protein